MGLGNYVAQLIPSDASAAAKPGMDHKEENNPNGSS
jgi:hypothetical protein